MCATINFCLVVHERHDTYPADRRIGQPRHLSVWQFCGVSALPPDQLPRSTIVKHHKSRLARAVLNSPSLDQPGAGVRTASIDAGYMHMRNDLLARMCRASTTPCCSWAMAMRTGLRIGSCATAGARLWRGGLLPLRVRQLVPARTVPASHEAHATKPNERHGREVTRSCAWSTKSGS